MIPDWVLTNHIQLFILEIIQPHNMKIETNIAGFFPASIYLSIYLMVLKHVYTF